MAQLERSLSRAAPKVDKALVAVDDILENLQGASRDLAETAREVKERPALLIRDVKRGYRKVRE